MEMDREQQAHDAARARRHLKLAQEILGPGSEPTQLQTVIVALMLAVIDLAHAIDEHN